MNFLPSRRGLGGFLISVAAVALSSLLFVGAHPNLLFPEGLPFLGWIAYLPVFWLLYRVKPGASAFWGALFGYTAASLFTYWMGDFNSVAGLVVNTLYMGYFIILFPLMKIALILFPRRGYLLQWFLWVGFEYVRTLGFLGYPYGITAYTQWSFIPLIQIAGIFGVWGVSALVIFPSIFFASLLRGDFPGSAAMKERFWGERFPALLYVLALGAALAYGLTVPADYTAEPQARLALIQHNTDPWKPSKAPTAKQAILEYENDLRILTRLSDEALAASADLDLVVWSETAFVPRIYWHTTYRDDQDSWELVKRLMDYLAAQKVPFVIGNDDARREISENGRWDRVDYNAVFLYDRGEMTQWYRKLHLVPFTEHFPYKKQFPWIYELLIKADTHIWKKGTEATVFDSGGLKFSTPICFEDSFGYLSRDFVRNGAQIIVNLSNDAWSKSLPAQMQHLSMAVFRAVENRRAMVRSTASGQTCGIDPRGRIIAMAEPFAEAWLTVEVPLLQEETPYTRYGDFLPPIFMALALIMLIAGIISYIMKNPKRGRTS